jgi:hypothetical protein
MSRLDDAVERLNDHSSVQDWADCDLVLRALSLHRAEVAAWRDVAAVLKTHGYVTIPAQLNVESASMRTYAFMAEMEGPQT